jgi:hypothetical protein
VVAALVVVLAGLGGYALGHSGRHDKKDAAAARRSGEKRAYLDARRELAARGRRAGTRAGRAAAAGHRPRKLPTAPRAKPTPTPIRTGGVKDCKTFFGKKRFVSSVLNITCGVAADEEGKAVRAGHPTRTPSGFKCQPVTPQQYRCTKGSQAYRWNVSP